MAAQTPYTTDSPASICIVDNSDSDWKVRSCVRGWSELPKAIGIATGYFEVSSLLALEWKWQAVARLRDQMLLCEIADTSSVLPAPMVRLLTIVTNFGILASGVGILISLSDFIISKERKKRIEEAIDTITLRLDYTKTLDWLQRWLKASRRAELADGIFALISGVLGIGIFILIVWVLWDDGPWWLSIICGIVGLMIWAWQWGYVEKGYKAFAPDIIKSLANANSYMELVVEYFWIILLGSLLLALCFAILIGVGYFVEGWGSFSRYLVGMGGNFTLGMAICWFCVIIDGVVTMFGALIVLVLRSLVDAARWIMWRISSYPKGPLAGVLTLVGAILAVVKLLVVK